MNYIQISTDLGPMTVTATQLGVRGLYLGAGGTSSPTPLLQQAASQVKQWLAGQRRDFNLPLDIEGTEFQRQVWRQLQAIPWGKTTTYGAIAQRLDKPGAARAVGGACGANPLLLIIPCHRVLASDGTLGGFSSGLTIKEHLLAREGIIKM